MGRAMKTITISLPPEMAAEIEEIRHEEGCTTSEVLREALGRYVEERQWKRLKLYAEQKARRRGVTTEEQVDELVHARRVREG